MCGIASHLRLRPRDAAPIAPGVAAGMLEAIRRRGPDGAGQWRSPDDLCWLGHRRLAVIDLHGGDQPMCNEDASVWTVFNGEIYNHLALRAELEACGHRFHTRSDTEVLVHGYEQWGLRGLAGRLQGIFAFAVYDVARRTLSLARDPMGVKPLYYAWNGRTFWFGSELKALRAFAAWEPEIDRDALGEYLLYCGDADELVFTENETHARRLFGVPRSPPYVKDAMLSASATTVCGVFMKKRADRTRSAGHTTVTRREIMSSRWGVTFLPKYGL